MIMHSAGKDYAARLVALKTRSAIRSVSNVGLPRTDALRHLAGPMMRQKASKSQISASCRRAFWRGGVGSGNPLKVQEEAAADPFLGLHLYIPPMQQHDLLAKTKSNPTPGLLRTKKRNKYIIHHLR